MKITAQEPIFTHDRRSPAGGRSPDGPDHDVLQDAVPAAGAVDGAGVLPGGDDVPGGGVEPFGDARRGDARLGGGLVVVLCAVARACTVGRGRRGRAAPWPPWSCRWCPSAGAPRRAGTRRERPRPRAGRRTRAAASPGGRSASSPGRRSCPGSHELRSARTHSTRSPTPWAAARSAARASGSAAMSTAVTCQPARREPDRLGALTAARLQAVPGARSPTSSHQVRVRRQLVSGGRSRHPPARSARPSTPGRTRGPARRGVGGAPGCASRHPG